MMDETMDTLPPPAPEKPPRAKRTRAPRKETELPEENMTEDRTQEMDTFPLGDIQSETVALHNTGYPDDDIREASNGDTQSPPETSEADPGEGFSEEAEEAAGSDDQEETQDMPQGISPQARIRELMSIPDNHKTEAQWDELIELEIAMAQGGRLLNLPAKQQKPGGKSSHGGQHPGQHNKNQKKPGHRPGGHPAQTQGQDNGGGGKPSGGQNKKFGRRFHKKPPKPAAG